MSREFSIELNKAWDIASDTTVRNCLIYLVKGEREWMHILSDREMKEREKNIRTQLT